MRRMCDCKTCQIEDLTEKIIENLNQLSSDERLEKLKQINQQIEESSDYFSDSYGYGMGGH